MDSIQPIENFSRPNPAEDSTKPKISECIAEANVAENSEKSDLKIVEKSLNDTKLTRKRKKPNHPPTSQMVLDSLKSLKMRKGIPAQAICKYIEEHYSVNIKSVTPHINKYLKTGVESGFLEQLSGSGADGRFKIKKTEGSSVQAKTKVTGISGKSNLKEVGKPPIDAKLPKREKSKHIPASDMVIESIKSLKMRNGASFQAIGEYMEGRYGVNMRSMKPYINRFLRTGVQKGILEQVSGDGVNGRFKIKKMEGASVHTKIKVTGKSGKSNLKKDRKIRDDTKASLMRKNPSYPPTSEMVIESIKSLKMRKGASFQAIGEYMEGHFGVNIKSVKPYIDRFLKTGVKKGILEQVSGTGVDGRFKIKKPEWVMKDKQKLTEPKERKNEKEMTAKPDMEFYK